MKILIDGKEFSEEEKAAWIRKRIGKVLKNLKKTLPMTDDTDRLYESLTTLKAKCPMLK